MATHCYCGCGRRLSFGLKRLSRKVGPEVRGALGLLKTYSRPYAEGDEGEVRIVDDLIGEGEAFDEQLRGYLHGMAPSPPATGPYFQWLYVANERVARDIAELKAMQAMTPPLLLQSSSTDDPLLAMLAVNHMTAAVREQAGGEGGRMTPERMAENLDRAFARPVEPPGRES